MPMWSTPRSFAISWPRTGSPGMPSSSMPGRRSPPWRAMTSSGSWVDRWMPGRKRNIPGSWPRSRQFAKRCSSARCPISASASGISFWGRPSAGGSARRPRPRSASSMSSSPPPAGRTRCSRASPIASRPCNGMGPRWRKRRPAPPSWRTRRSAPSRPCASAATPMACSITARFCLRPSAIGP